ncbi:MAG TPA: MgtC/SapB family protein [Candidatus Paceibacterota bacterium]|nr:MgtC/SapB family protein [Candidatus Paceibacterota bacterium]
MTQFFITNQDIIIKLLLSMVLGMAIGVERYIAHKSAGMRTYALLSMGAALLVILGTKVIASFANLSYVNMSPIAVIAAIITGIGFLGAGAMFKKESTLVGLTTATGLWVSAGIGMAVGFGYYSLALIATVLTLFIFVILWFLEKKIVDPISGNPQDENKLE